MDLSLFAASVGCAVYLSQHLASKESDQGSKELYPVKIALCLSLWLVSLSVLETLPSSWLLVLTDGGTEKNQTIPVYGYLTITSAYRFLLWNLSLFVLIVFPCLVGTQIVGRLLFRIQGQSAKVDPDEQKKRNFEAQRNTSWTRRAGYRIVLLIVRAVRLVIVVPCTRLGGRVYRSCCFSQDTPVLVMTQKDCQRNQAEGSRRLALFIGSSLYRQSLVVGSIIGVAATGTALKLIAPLVFHTSEASPSTLLGSVSWLCAVGILLSSVLNGFGSVSMPHSCLAGLYLKPVPPEAIARAEIELQKAEASLRDRKAELHQEVLMIRPSDSSTLTWQRSIQPSRSFSEMSDNSTHRRTTLQTEVEFLQSLVGEMAEDVIEMKHSQVIAAGSRTSVGRIRSWVGVVFSIILLVRLFAAFVSIFTDPGQFGSTAETGHKWVGLLWRPSTPDALSQFVSLALTAFLSFSQIRNFLRIATGVNRRLDQMLLSCHCKVKKEKDAAFEDQSAFAVELRTHILASLLGCYFISCIVLTKMMLPPEYRVSFSAALGGKDVFQVRRYTVNVAFALSAVASALTLGMLLGIQRQNTHRYTQPDKTIVVNGLDP